MEIAIHPAMPTYSGGLGVLAGDTLRSAADLGVPLVAFTLLHRKGYFRQRLDPSGGQTESVQAWNPADFCTEEPARVTVAIEDRKVTVRAWRYDLVGRSGHVVPIYLLDTDLEGNSGWDRGLTDHLYGGDTNYRLQQEIVLGMGGARMVQRPGTACKRVPHERGARGAADAGAAGEPAWRRPAERGNGDRPGGGAQQVRIHHAHAGSGRARPLLDRAGDPHPGRGADGAAARSWGFSSEGLLNMTLLALRFSRYANGVALQHGKVSREMFPEFAIDSITNGVHAPTWVSEPVQSMLDRHIPAWRRDMLYLRNAIDLPLDAMRQAHARAKEALLAEVASRTGLVLNPKVLTLGFARRVATYKRAGLMFTDTERLAKIAQAAGGLQILYAGKAHPQDEGGKSLIRQVFERSAQLSNDMLRIVYLENYAWDLGAMLTSGVDVWVNTPRRPYEASGTSGMKAALNGVPSLSILDGWWIEGCIEGVTGWAIADGADDQEEAGHLYGKLENTVVPLYCKRSGRVDEVDANHDCAQRIVLQYQSDGEAVHAQCVLPGEAGGECAGGRGGFRLKSRK